MPLRQSEASSRPGVGCVAVYYTRILYSGRRRHLLRTAAPVWRREHVRTGGRGLR